MASYIVPVHVTTLHLVAVETPDNLGAVAMESMAADRAKESMASAHPGARLHIGIARKSPPPA